MSRSSLLLVLPVFGLLQACETFGGGHEHARHERHEHGYAAHNMNADCERLAPYVVNTDGSLAKSDLDAGLKTDFKKWDANGDGQLNQAEVEPLNEYLRALNVGASPVMDWNGDGHVTYEEFASGWRTMFDLCAREGSEIVTKADLERSPNVTPPLEKPKDDEIPQNKSSPRTGGSGY